MINSLSPVFFQRLRFIAIINLASIPSVALTFFWTQGQGGFTLGFILWLTFWVTLTAAKKIPWLFDEAWFDEVWSIMTNGVRSFLVLTSLSILSGTFFLAYGNFELHISLAIAVAFAITQFLLSIIFTAIDLLLIFKIIRAKVRFYNTSKKPSSKKTRNKKINFPGHLLDDFRGSIEPPEESKKELAPEEISRLN